MKPSDKAIEIMENLISEIHRECQNGRQRCLRELRISLREIKEIFEIMKREGR